LSLQGYGAYSLGVHLASAVSLAVSAVHAAILPRMTKQVALNNNGQITTLYSITTSLTLAISSACVVGLHTGGNSIAPSLNLPVSDVQPVVVGWIYGLGNIAVALMAMSYQLQNALGKLRIHAAGSILQATFQIPIIAWAASSGDVIRVAWVYSSANWIFALVWLQVVHYKLLPGGAKRWFFRVFSLSFAACATSGLLTTKLSEFFPAGLFWALCTTTISMGITFVSALIVNKDIRDGINRLSYRK